MARKRKSRNRNGDLPMGLEQSTGHWIRVLHRLFQQSLQAKLAPHGVKLSHWHCLRYLWEEDGLTQRELSRRVHVKESTTVAVIKEMESADLIKRTRDRVDRRKYAVHLTPKGRRITKKLLPVARTVNEASAADFSPEEVAAYQALTRRLIVNLQGILPTNDEHARTPWVD